MKNRGLVMIVVLFVVFLCVGIIVHSPSIDESAHLPAGLSHWYSGKIQLYCVNPPLIRLAASAPVYLAGPKYDWSAYDSSWGNRSEFEVGRRFIAVNGADSIRYFRLARLVLVPFAVLGLLALYSLSNSYSSGLAAVMIGLFSPLLIAHISLITPDAWAGIGGVLFTCILRRCRHKSSLMTFAITGAAAGYLVCIKTTWLFVLPIVIIFWSGVEIRAQAKAWWLSIAARAAISIGAFFLVINAVYGFRDTLPLLRECPLRSKSLRGFGSVDIAESDSTPRRTIEASTVLNHIRLPIPKSMIEGIDTQKGDFERGFRSYLMGEWKHGGWWYYYLVGFLVKEPIGFQLMLYVSILHGLWNWKRWTKESFREWSLIALPPLLIFGLVSSQTGFNHHMRYVLPAYPFLFIIAARTVTLGKFWKWFSFGCLTWQAASVLWFAPHWMSYFNEFAGGPRHGHDWLVDSNIDWGQDILGLKWWQDKHPDIDLQAALFTGFDPKDIGLKYRLPAPYIAGQPDVVSKEGLRGPQPGWYAISVCQLKGMHFSVPAGDGNWEWSAGHFTYFMDHFEPVDMIGYSIYIYHISKDETDAVHRKLRTEEETLDERQQQADESERRTHTEPARGHLTNQIFRKRTYNGEAAR